MNLLPYSCSPSVLDAGRAFVASVPLHIRACPTTGNWRTEVQLVELYGDGTADGMTVAAASYAPFCPRFETYAEAYLVPDMCGLVGVPDMVDVMWGIGAILVAVACVEGVRKAF